MPAIQSPVQKVRILLMKAEGDVSSIQSLTILDGLQRMSAKSVKLTGCRSASLYNETLRILLNSGIIL